MALAVAACVVLAALLRREGERAAPAIGPVAEAIALVAVTLAALALRVPGLGHIPPGLWVDEAVEGLQAAAAISGETLPRLPDPDIVYPRWPVWWLLETVSLRFAGMTVEAVRYPAAIVGTLTVPLAWLAARSLWGPLAGLTAAVFLAFSFWHIQYSRMGLAPVLLVMECLLAGWLVLVPRPRRPALAGLALGLLCAVACLDYTAALALPLWAAVAVLARFTFADKPSAAARRAAVWSFAGLAAGGVVLIALARMFLAARVGRVGTIGIAAPGDVLAQSGVCLANFFSPVAAARAYWDNFPPGAPRCSPVENFAWLAGLAAALGLPWLARWRRLALALSVPVLLLPEVLPGTREGVYLVRGIGLLGGLALLAGLGARAWAPLAGRAALAALLAVGAASAWHAGWMVYGPFAKSELARRLFVGVASDVAGGLRAMARLAPIRVYPPLSYSDNPQIAFYLREDIRAGRIGQASSPPAGEGAAAAVFPDPVGKYPVVVAVVSKKWPSDRTVGLLDVQGSLLEAQDMERKGRLREAEELYAMVIHLVPDYWQVRAGLGMLCLREGRKKEAVKHLSAAVSLGAPPEIKKFLDRLEERERRKEYLINKTIQENGGMPPPPGDMLPFPNDKVSPAVRKPYRGDESTTPFRNSSTQGN